MDRDTRKRRNPDPKERDSVQRMLERYARTRDPQLKEALVGRHLRLVGHLASRYRDRGEPYQDLFQVGALALLRALDRFDPGRGVDFASYVIPSIEGEIKRHFRDRTWAIRVPRRLKQLGVKLNGEADRMAVCKGRMPGLEELARHLGSTPGELQEARAVAGARRPMGIDAELAPGSGTTLAGTLGEQDRNLDQVVDRMELLSGLGDLTARERKILYWRFYEGQTQSEVGRRLGISQMHVSRLQRRALAKMREALNGNGRAA